MVWPFGKKKKLDDQPKAQLVPQPTPKAAPIVTLSEKQYISLKDAEKATEKYFELSSDFDDLFYRRCESKIVRAAAYKKAQIIIDLLPAFKAGCIHSHQVMNEYLRKQREEVREFKMPNCSTIGDLAAMYAEDRRYDECLETCAIGELLEFPGNWERCKNSCDPLTTEHTAVRRDLYYCHVRQSRDSFNKSEMRETIDAHVELNTELRDAPVSKQSEVASKLVKIADKAAKAMVAEEQIHRSAATSAEYDRDPKPLPSHPGFKRLAIDAEKDGRFDEAIRFCEVALAQGWSGDWEKRIERCRKKVSKEVSKAD